jgi:hypothetical protein
MSTFGIGRGFSGAGWRDLLLRKHAVGHPDNVRGDPAPGPSMSREPAMDDDVLSVGED